MAKDTGQAGSSAKTGSDKPINNGDSSTASTGAGGGRGRRGTGGKASSEEKRVLEPVLVDIDLPGAEKEEKPKSKRGRPKGSTATKKKPSTPQASSIDPMQLQVLLLTVSGIVSSRPGMEMWNLTPDEAQQIAKPLTNMMAKNEALSKVAGEHADALALITACFMIFVPKFMMYQASKPKKPKEGKKLTYERANQPARPAEPARDNRPPVVHGGSNDGSAATNAQTNGGEFGGQLFSIIAPTASI